MDSRKSIVSCDAERGTAASGKVGLGLCLMFNCILKENQGIGSVGYILGKVTVCCVVDVETAASGQVMLENELSHDFKVTHTKIRTG